MRRNTFAAQLLLLGITLNTLALQAATKSEAGFVSLFDGKTLAGWKAVGQRGEGYVPQNGVLICPKTGGGNLFTEKEYDNFIFRFDFKLSESGNNGVGIR